MSGLCPGEGEEFGPGGRRPDMTRVDADHAARGGKTERTERIVGALSGRGREQDRIQFAHEAAPDEAGERMGGDDGEIVSGEIAARAEFQFHRDAGRVRECGDGRR